jgi:Protein of unknown function (DUF2442)
VCRTPSRTSARLRCPAGTAVFMFITNTSERRPGERVRDVRSTEDVLIVDLLDGRTISVPLVWYPRLLGA